MANLDRTKFGTDAGGLNLAARPALNLEGQTDRRVLQTILDLRQPARAGRGQAKLDSELGEGELSLGTKVSEGAHGERYSTGLNVRSSPKLQTVGSDIWSPYSDNANMAAPNGPDWYLREWFAYFDMKQHALIKDLGYAPQTAQNLWHGIQPYRRDYVIAIAAHLNIAPYELLMPPEEAMRLRRLRSVIAEVAQPEPEATAPATPRTGTSG